MSRRKGPEAPPDEFASYEEAAAFWGEHDSADYPDAFELEGVVVQADDLRRHFEVEVAPDVVEKLRQRARREGVSPSELASELLRRQLAPAS